MPVRVEPVDPSSLAGLRHLTFPAVLKLACGRHAGTVRALVAQTSDETAGLALAVPGPAGQFELLSLFVAPLFRRLGFGSLLLRAVEDDFRARDYREGVHFLTLQHGEEGRASFYLANGWSKPSLNRLICRSTIANAMRTPWLITAELGTRHRIVDWSSLGPTERASLQAAAGDWYNDEVDPFLVEAGCDDATSVALVDAETGAVRGWAITHRLDDTTLRWTSSFVHPDLQESAAIRGLWLEVAQRQERRTELVDFIFTASVDKPRMARFALRRMRPWLSSLGYSCTITKKVA
jgi:GNAT superfamily N-acetyltransferase